MRVLAIWLAKKVGGPGIETTAQEAELWDSFSGCDIMTPAQFFFYTIWELSSASRKKCFEG
jgi:hypothetical protein